MAACGAMSSNNSTTAFLFPGQGAHCPQMLDGLSQCPAYTERLALISNLLGVNPLTKRDDLEFINSNKVSSLLTTLASSLSLDLVRQQGIEPRCTAGYSVGQWTALYAAGSISFAELADIVHARASFMDECFSDRQGAMLAVIGLPLDTVESVCRDVQSRLSGAFLTVSNFNCVGQYSLAGDIDAIEAARAQFESMATKKVQKLPVAGAWHCELLHYAETKFLDYLCSREMTPPAIPVCDNVTGTFLPAAPERLRVQLARQIASPVQWEGCIKTMLTAGCTELVEIGFGNVLTKFGFFISRKVAHKAFYAATNGG